MNLLRGPLLWPVGPDRLVCLADGVVGPGLEAPRAAVPGDPEPEDGLILPAFADWHVHFVQLGIAGVARPGGPPLLTWLREHAWPAEQAFADAARCRDGARDALARMAAVGTLAGAVYGSPHAASAEAFLDAAPQGFVCGPAVMTEGGPPGLVTSAEGALGGLRRLHARFGARVAVTPRFALSCGAEVLAALGAFANEHHLVVQTHLAETEAEVDAVRARFPDARDYLDVYERAGLVRPGTLLAHVIHASDDELDRIALSGAVVVHCPTSNAALGSGRMPLERLRAAGVRWVLGSDVGAGPDLCMLDVVAAALEQHDGHAPVTAGELFHRASVGRGVGRGMSEEELPCRVRPGAIVVAPPSELDLRVPDGAAWLDSLIADWRARRRFAVRRAVPWAVG